MSEFLPRGRRKALVLIAVIVIQVALLVWVNRLTSAMRQEWPNVVKSTPAQVFVIQAERFWGPVTAIVPRRCSEIDRWQSISEGETKLRNATGNVSRGGPQHDLTVADLLPNLRSMNGSSASTEHARKLAAAAHDVAIVTKHSMEVRRCNESMRFGKVGYFHQYFSMILLSDALNHFTGGIQDAAALQKVRVRTHHQLIVGIIVCMLLKYALVIADLLAQVFGHRYVQLWNQGRTTFDRALESLLIHGVSIIYTLGMQMALCALFLTFWRDDHFIMSFFPGFGIFLYGLTLVCFVIYTVIDRFNGYMLKCGHKYIYVFWTFWFFWTVLLTIPMIGYCCYSLNFMFRVTEMHWVQEEADLFSPEFAKNSIAIAKATGGFLVVALVDFLSLLALDVDAL